MTQPSLPASLLARLATPHLPIGVSGSRTLDGIDQPVLDAVLDALAASHRPRLNIMVGDGFGVDRAVRERFPDCRYFQRLSDMAGGFAGRSITFTRSLAAASGMLIAFPATSCPVRVWPTAIPSKAFNGSKAGTWSTAALAIGLRRPVWIYLPEGAEMPPWQQDITTVDGPWIECNGGMYDD